MGAFFLAFVERLLGREAQATVDWLYETLHDDHDPCLQTRSAETFW
jgi:hypothetical protein